MRGTVLFVKMFVFFLPTQRNFVCPTIDIRPIFGYNK